MAELPEFQKKQYAFAAHIRDPENVPAPEGIEDRRMAIYRELFFNNIRNLLANMMVRIHTADGQWRSVNPQGRRLRHRPMFPSGPQGIHTSSC